MVIIFVIGLATFLFPGIILKTKAFLSGRYGAGILQPWKDMWKLVRKGAVFSSTSSIIFQIAPTIYLATVLCATLLLPFDNQPSFFNWLTRNIYSLFLEIGLNREISLMLFLQKLSAFESWSFKGDFVFFAYILALGRFFMILSAMDVGSPFEGMGANREALYGMLVEPAFFIWAGSLAMLTGYTSFQDIYSHLNFESNYFVLVLGLLATYLLVQVALVENSRMPVDDPTTHLELTMVHEAMILDNSGFDLAMIQLSSALKFVVYGTLIGNFFMIQEWHWFFNSIILLVVQVIFAVTIGVVESFRARNPLDRNPQFIIALSSIAIIIFFTVLIITQKYIS
jgi:formate hydrogenlyase subunit 4